MLHAIAILLGTASSAWCAATRSAPPPPRLGEHPADLADMTAVPVLQHLAASMPEATPRTPAGLLADRSHRYLTAPDPHALFTAEAKADSGEATDHAIKVLSYDVGLLDTRWMLGLRRIRMPEVGSRRSELPTRLLRDDWDILLLQEVWAWADVVRFAEAAEREGYVWFAGSERRHNQHGLVILVKGSIIDGAQRRTEGVFEDQGRKPLSQGPRLGAGYLTWSFTHTASQRRVRIATTRLFDGHTATSWHTRSMQARQLGIDLATSDDDTVLIVGGDMGTGPYHPEGVLGPINGRDDQELWQESTTWAMLRHYGDLVDTATYGHAAGDIEAMHALPEWNRGWTKRPLHGWCAQLPPDRFTSTDCNRLHFAHHRGELVPSRRDQLLVRMADDQGALGTPGLWYVEPEPVRGRTHTLSHRYGVGLDIYLE